MKIRLLTLALSALTLLSSSKAFAGNPDGENASAQLIVYRDGCIYGLLKKYKVIIDDKEMATLKNKSSYKTSLSAGSHVISPKSEKRSVTINAKAGETYVVKYKTRFGLLGAYPKPEVMTLAEAKEDSDFFMEEVNK